MSHRTPWSQSSLPSDRIKQKSRPSTPVSSKSKGKAKDVQPQAPKSAAVRALETAIADLQGTSGDEKDPNGGCFCQARTHALSAHTPLCMHCGLILCVLNPAHRSCPHCNTPLLSAAARSALLGRLRSELEATGAQEEEDAARAREEARVAAGAFPQLGEAAGADNQAKAPPQTHKVLSLNAKTKRVTVASYSPAPSPAPSRPQESEGPRAETPPTRVPPPPREIVYASRPPDPARPWADVRGDGFARTLTYVRDPQIEREEARENRKARKAMKAAAANENDGVPSEAGG